MIRKQQEEIDELKSKLDSINTIDTHKILENVKQDHNKIEIGGSIRFPADKKE